MCFQCYMHRRVAGLGLERGQEGQGVQEVWRVEWTLLVSIASEVNLQVS